MKFNKAFQLCCTFLREVGFKRMIVRHVRYNKEKEENQDKYKNPKKYMRDKGMI